MGFRFVSTEWTQDYNDVGSFLRIVIDHSLSGQAKSQNEINLLFDKIGALGPIHDNNVLPHNDYRVINWAELDRVNFIPLPQLFQKRVRETIGFNCPMAPPLSRFQYFLFKSRFCVLLDILQG